jgi:glycosyltransferase involved in cell wall biosynthesis
MKIALVTGEFPPMEGGVGAFTQELARAMAALKHDVHIITSSSAATELKKQRFGRLPEPNDIGYAHLYPAIKRWRWPSVSTIADLTLRYEFDVVNIQYQAAAYNMKSPAINILPWRIKHIVRTIVTFHDLRVPYLFPKAGPMRDGAISFMARQAGGSILTNAGDYQAMRKRVDTPLVNIPIGSNIETYTPNHIEIAEAREMLGLGEGDVLLGYFGFVNESKGADTAVEALAELPESYHLVFIGGQTGASDETNTAFLVQIRDLVVKLGLDQRVYWTGFLEDKRVSTYLKAADLIVLPYRDGVSLRRGTLMAALAHGCPIVTTYPSAPVEELVHGENVWFFAPDDAAALAGVIRVLMQNDDLRQRLGSGAKQAAGNFSWDKIAHRTVGFYQSIDDPRTKGAV